MEAIISFALLVGVVLVLVLFAMLLFVKAAHGRVERSPEEKRAQETQMEGAPAALRGVDKPTANTSARDHPITSRSS